MTAANVDRRWIGTNARGAARSRASHRPVAFLNDADAAGLAEMRLGAGRGRDGTVLVLTLGTGIGSALFVDGRLVPNTELGHLEVGGEEAEQRASARVRVERGLDWPAWAAEVNEVLAEMHRLLWPDLFIIGGGVTENWQSVRAAAVEPRGDRASRATATMRASIGAAMAAVESGDVAQRESARASLAASKLPDVGTTIFTVMSRLAAEHGAINLSQGFPDFSPPPRLVELVAAPHACRAQPVRADARAAGVARSDRAPRCWRCTGDACRRRRRSRSRPAGRRRSSARCRRWSIRGDEVILLDPAYDSYEPAVRLAGGGAVRVPLRRPGFDVDWDRVRDALSRTDAADHRQLRRTTRAARCSPGAISRRWPTCSKARTCSCSRTRSTSTWCSTGAAHQGLLALDALAARSFVVSSFGKTYHATGWKVGYCIAPAALTTELRKVHQFVQFSVATPLQAAIADFLAEVPGHTLELARFYQRKRDHFCGLLAQTRFRCSPSAGTYFQLADYSARRDEPDVEFARRLTMRARRRRDSGVGILRAGRRSSGWCASASPRTKLLSTRPANGYDGYERNGAAVDMNPHLRVTMVQADLAWEDPATNRRAWRGISRGLAGHTDLIVLPEMFSTGFTMNSAAQAEDMDGPTVGLDARGGRGARAA